MSKVQKIKSNLLPENREAFLLKTNIFYMIQKKPLLDDLKCHETKVMTESDSMHYG